MVTERVENGLQITETRLTGITLDEHIKNVYGRKTGFGPWRKRVDSPSVPTPQAHFDSFVKTRLSEDKQHILAVGLSDEKLFLISDDQIVLSGNYESIDFVNQTADHQSFLVKAKYKGGYEVLYTFNQGGREVTEIDKALEFKRLGYLERNHNMFSIWAAMLPEETKFILLSDPEFKVQKSFTIPEQISLDKISIYDSTQNGDDLEFIWVKESDFGIFPNGGPYSVWDYYTNNLHLVKRAKQFWLTDEKRKYIAEVLDENAQIERIIKNGKQFYESNGWIELTSHWDSSILAGQLITSGGSEQQLFYSFGNDKGTVGPYDTIFIGSIKILGDSNISAVVERNDKKYKVEISRPKTPEDEVKVSEEPAT